MKPIIKIIVCEITKTSGAIYTALHFLLNKLRLARDKHSSSLDPFIKLKGKWSVVNTTPAGYVVLRLLISSLSTEK
jgi:hypothetical protein